MHSPDDVLARVLLGDARGDALHAARGAARAAAASAPHAGRRPTPRRARRRTAGARPAPLNTDDNARIELAAPRDLIGFERYKGYLETIYAASWPYGRLVGRACGHRHGRGRRASATRELALALLAHGRKREAPRRWSRAAERAARRPSSRCARGVLRACSARRDGRAALATRSAPPSRDPASSERANARIADGARRGARLARATASRSARARALERMPSSPACAHAGPSCATLRALRAAAHGGATDRASASSRAARAHRAGVRAASARAVLLPRARARRAACTSTRPCARRARYVEARCARDALAADPLPEPDATRRKPTLQAMSETGLATAVRRACDAHLTRLAKQA